MIVVDLGCHTHRGYHEDESVERLLARFSPYLLVGFDPHPDVQEGMTRYGDVPVFLNRRAAWTFDGTIRYDPRPDRPLAAAVGSGPLTVQCFNLATWLRDTGPVTLKMDVEGAEYPLLAHLLATSTATLVEHLLVEWHHPPIGPDDWEQQRDALLARLPSPVEEW